MRLTQLMRDAFVRAAMADVPRVDYEKQIADVILADAVSQLPAKVLALYKDKNIGHFVNVDRVYICGAGRQVPKGRDAFNAKPETIAAVEKLQASLGAQVKKHDELRAKLRGCAYACSTRKALAEMLPEFEKYMPASEAQANRQLPVAANIVAEFMQAGWPKGQKK